jgi:hypothetical protein
MIATKHESKFFAGCNQWENRSNWWPDGVGNYLKEFSLMRENIDTMYFDILYILTPDWFLSYSSKECLLFSVLSCRSASDTTIAIILLSYAGLKDERASYWCD